MKKEIAQTVLESLLERCEKSADNSPLTSHELEALRVLLFGEAAEGSAGTKAGSADEVPEIAFTTPKAIDEDRLMCLDFGTSFSKAAACSAYDSGGFEKLHDLSFGKNELGEPNPLLPSELFVDDGVLYLGASARAQFDAIQAPQDRLIDSPKQFITLAVDVTKLHRRKLSPSQDSTKKLTQRDALVIYIAHLNLRAEQSLQENGLSPNLKRRYTHPSWNEEHFKQNSEAMQRIFAEAIAISRCCKSDLESRLPLARALGIVQKARDAKEEDLPFGLVGDPVLEATAAGAGALVGTEGRQSYVILDIGAGTTDVAGCICVSNPETNRTVVAEVTPAAVAINQAGNIIDNALLNLVMNKSGLAKGMPEYEIAQAAVRRGIRGNKELLFIDGGVEILLVTEDVVSIEKDEFLEQKVVKNVFGKIRGIVEKAALLVAGDNKQVFVAATGGGAGLPVVADLDGIFVDDGKGSKVELILRDPMPEDLKEEYSHLEDVYPQLAVAVGGALPDLPSQVGSVQEGIRDPGRKYLAPMYKK